MKYLMGIAFISVGAALGFAASEGLHAQGKPVAYSIVFQDIIDDAKIQPILDGFATEQQKAGAKYLARGKPAATIDGTAPGRVTVILYKDLDEAKKFYDSDAVKKLQAARKPLVKNSTIILVEGVQ
jgi:uncharacterized protein (DUF1330 family)